MSLFAIVRCDHANAPVKFHCLQVLALALVLCASGCIVIPTPEFNSGQARGNITKETPAQFEVGKTTRAELVLALGEPDAVSPDEHIWAYRSEKIRAIVCFAGYTTAACGPITKDLYLLLQFNEQGVLQKIESSSHWFTSADSDKMLPAAAGSKAATTDASLSARLQKPAFWLKGVDGYKPRGAAQMRGLPGKLLLTDANLQFFADVPKGEFANIAPTGPELILPFAAITAVRVDSYGFGGRRLVVRTSANEAHSFEISKGFFNDAEALQSFAEFIQGKINR